MPEGYRNAVAVSTDTEVATTANYSQLGKIIPTSGWDISGIFARVTSDSGKLSLRLRICTGTADDPNPETSDDMCLWQDGSESDITYTYPKGDSVFVTIKPPIQNAKFAVLEADAIAGDVTVNRAGFMLSTSRRPWKPLKS